MPSLAFPDSDENDPTAVVSALETGRRDWDKGELREAVRWVHRAADAAEAAGNDTRALALARAAADLVSSLEGTPEGRGHDARDEASALAPFDDFNDQTIVDSPAVMVARQTAQGTVSIEDRPAVPRPDVTARLGTHALRARTTLRVAVSLAPVKDGNLRVALLPDGAAAPSGTTEALLVVVDPDARLPVQVAR